MPCKYLGTKLTIIPPEIDGSLTPDAVPMPHCKINRTPDTIGWVNKCKNTPSNGPCWFWKQMHPNKTDPGFAGD